MSGGLEKPAAEVARRAVGERVATLVDAVPQERSPRWREGIAIVGMSARFPGCDSVDEYWKRLVAGDSLLSESTDEDLREAGVDPDSAEGSHFVRSGTLLENAESFDAKFFDMSRREAEVMDPQHRIFLECAYEALEHAGIRGDGENVGVFAGAGMNTYMLQLLGNPEMLASAGGYQLMLGNDKDFMATRVAYKLNFKGPAAGVQTACSTSLAAVHLACQSLLLGECDCALAGGVSVGFPQVAGYGYIPGMILSPDGLCRPFDEAAQGTVPGKGAGVVVLKRESDAVQDGDKIYAVIAGSAWNNDGSAKAGYTAPSIEGQVKVIRAAHAAAAVSARQIGYVEAHGTGTELGDPIEVAALAEAFGSRDLEAARCVLGSVKANMGHADVAAGVAGLIKAAQAIYHGVVPGTPHFEKANPALELELTPFRISATSEPFPEEDGERWAGVSSFGIGGTNVHLCLKSAPSYDPQQGSREQVGPWVFSLSAKTESGLLASRARLAEFVESAADPDGLKEPLRLADIAGTLQMGRRDLNFRLAVVAQTREELVGLLRKPLKLAGSAGLARAEISAIEAGSNGPRVAFLFPGQGTQFAGMATALYETDAKFRMLVDRGLSVLPEVAAREIVAFGFEESAFGSSGRIATAIAQPLLLIVEYALAMRWIDLGVKPNALVGHSLGELTAATVAGVFSYEDGVRLAAERGRLMQNTQPGAMLAISLSVDQVTPYLTSELWIAAENAPRLTVVSGSEESIAELAKRLSSQHIAAVRLGNDRAFHTPHMAEAATLFRDAVAAVKRSTPKIPWLSNVSGTWITAEEATSPQYWADQITARVRFVENAEILSKRGCFLLEVGPGDSLGVLVCQLEQPPSALRHASTLGRETRSGDGHRAFLAAAGRLWARGTSIHWQELPGNVSVGEGNGPLRFYRRVALPTYPFERERYWVEVTRSSTHEKGSQKIDAKDGDLEAGLAAEAEDPFAKRDDISSWFYVPGWQRTPTASLALSVRSKVNRWVILGDDGDFGDRLALRLKEAGTLVLSLAKKRASRAGLDGFWSEHREWVAAGTVGLIDCWAMRASLSISSTAGNLNSRDGIESRGAGVADAYEGLLLALQSAQAARVRFAQVEVIVDELVEVNGEGVAEPRRAIAEGLARILSAEFAGVRGRVIDPGSLLGVVSDKERLNTAAELVASEIRYVASTCLTVAYRSGYRWQQTWQSVPLEAAKTSKFRQGGVYLITGGLGGVSFLFTKYLMERYGAKVALLGRTQLPPEQSWGDWLTEYGAADPTSRKIERAKELSEVARKHGGVEYQFYKADVADRVAVGDVVASVEERFGPIHGVLHAAGLPGGVRVASQDMRAVNETFRPKVTGSEVLAELFAGRQLDFMLFCSSISAVLSLAGAADYAAANAFQDRYATWCRQQLGVPAVSVNFDAWRDVGMIAELEAAADFQYVKDDRLRTAMTSEEGLEILERALGTGEAQVLVSTMDFDEVLQSTSRSWSTASAGLQKDAPATMDNATAAKDLELIAEQSREERAVIDIWQELLGAKSVVPSDNFFELGGHSLLGTMVLARIRERFAVDLTIRAIFEAPTPRLLGRRIQEAHPLRDSVDESAGEPVGVSGEREEFTF